jgi:phage recombination protein Bet
MSSSTQDYQIIPQAAPQRGQSKRDAYTKEDLRVLQQAGVIPADCPQEQVQIFAQVCKETGLSPFRKQVCSVGFWSKDKNCNVYSIIVTNEGLRVLLNRTGCYAGCDETTYNNNLSMFDMASQIEKQGVQAIKTCTFTAYFLDARGNKNKFTKTVAFSEFNSGKMKWATMPLQMIEKVAKSFCYKEMLGDEMAGLMVDAEIDAAQGIPQNTPMVIIQDALLQDAIKMSERCLTKEDVKTAVEDFKKKHKLNTLEYAPQIHQTFNKKYKSLSA